MITKGQLLAGLAAYRKTRVCNEPSPGYPPCEKCGWLETCAATVIAVLKSVKPRKQRRK